MYSLPCLLPRNNCLCTFLLAWLGISDGKSFFLFEVNLFCLFFSQLFESFVLCSLLGLRSFDERLTRFCLIFSVYFRLALQTLDFLLLLFLNSFLLAFFCHSCLLKQSVCCLTASGRVFWLRRHFRSVYRGIYHWVVERGGEVQHFHRQSRIGKIVFVLLELSCKWIWKSSLNCVSWVLHWI